MVFSLKFLAGSSLRTAQVTWDEANLNFTAAILAPPPSPSFSEIVGARVGVREPVGLVQFGDVEIELGALRTVRGYDLNAYDTLIRDASLGSLLLEILPGQYEATFGGELDQNDRASFESEIAIEHDPALGCIAIQFDPQAARAGSKFHELAEGVYLALDDAQEIKTLLARYR